MLVAPARAPTTRKRKKHYRIELRPDQPLAASLRDVLLHEYDVAIDVVRLETDRAKAIHEARKAMKRSRALLRLIRTELGRETYRAENLVLRDTARRLSPARSAAVMAQVAPAVFEAAGIDPHSAAAKGLFDELQTRRFHTLRAVSTDQQLVIDVAATLLQARTRLSKWAWTDTESYSGRPVRSRVRDSFEAIAPGIARVYGRGRREMAAVLAQPTTAGYHQWRKRVKYLRYQLEALHLIWPEAVGDAATAFAEIAEALGTDHDYADLSDLVGRADLVPDHIARHSVGRFVAEQRLELQERAHSLGTHLYQETPHVFVRRLGTYWEAARSVR